MFNLSRKVQKVRMIMFTSETCKFCPIIEKIIRKFIVSGLGNQVSLTTVDVDLAPETSAQFNIRKLPTVIMGTGSGGTSSFERIVEGYMEEEDIRDRLMNKVFQLVLAGDAGTRKRKENLIWLTKNTIESVGVQKNLIRPNVGDYVHLQGLQINNMSLLALDRLAAELLYESGKIYGNYGPGQMFLVQLNPEIMRQIRLVPRFSEIMKALVMMYSKADQFPLYNVSSAELVHIENLNATLRIFGSAYAVGAPNIKEPLCYSLSGEIAGIIQAVLGKFVRVTETSCWGTGTPYCDFLIEVLDEEPRTSKSTSDSGKKEVARRRNTFVTSLAEMAEKMHDSLLFKRQLREVGDYVHITVIQQAFTALKIIDPFCGMLLYSSGLTFGLTSDKSIIQNWIIERELPQPLDFSLAVKLIAEEMKHPTTLLTRQHSFIKLNYDEEDPEEIAYIKINELAYSAGATNVGETFCDFMAGFINGRLQLLLEDETSVKEIQCYGKGDPFCIFRIQLE